jgi:MoaA/NifB/PqqE/SkfB family radical SAM enzyme
MKRTSFAKGTNIYGRDAIKTGLLCLKDAFVADSYRYLGFPEIVPTMVNIKATYKCNSRCTMCNLWKLYKKDDSRLKDEMTYSEFVSFMEQSPFIQDILISGGEPYMADDIIPMWIWLDRHGYRTGVNTNAIDFDFITGKESETLKQMSGKNARYMTISIDGIGKVHDGIRGIKGNFDSAMRLLEWGLNTEKEYPFFSVGVSYTLTPKNVDEFPDFFDFIIAKGVKPQRVNFRGVQEMDFLYGNKGEVDQFVHAKRMIDSIRKVQAKYSPLKKSFYVNGIIKFLQHPEKLVIPCYMAYRGAIIDPYWDVYACMGINEVICNLREYNFDLRKAWKDKRVKDMQKRIRNGDCMNCWGGCTSVKSAVSGVTNLARLAWAEKWRLV